MAHAHVSTYTQSPVVETHDNEIHIECGSFSIRMRREEAAHLAADLLNAVDATSVDMTEVAA